MKWLLKRRKKELASYEVMFITKPFSDEEVNSVVDEVKEVIVANGNLIKADVWGEKLLSYNLDGYEKGVYVLITFEGNATCINAIDHKLRINEGVLRHMIIKKC